MTPAATQTTAADWFEAVLLMIYSYGGFEAALIPAGETRDARKDIPFALFIATGATTLLLIAVQYLVIHTIPNVATSSAPAPDSARRSLPPLSVRIVAARHACLRLRISKREYTAHATNHAIGQHGDFPAFFGRIHPRFRTPHLSIVIFATVLLLFSIVGNFRWNALLSSVARLFVYGSVAAALPALRKTHSRAEAFRLPHGVLIAGLALLFTGVLVTRMHLGELIVISITAVLAFVNWLWARKQVTFSQVVR